MKYLVRRIAGLKHRRPKL